ncbi:MAG: amidohydrolase [Clostridiales Family XIII bacterium]|jgi:predicted amidohydrolase YtcJ|nr:amidohydrolase [Clostridiales Family XIII bacterium]
MDQHTNLLKIPDTVYINGHIYTGNEHEDIVEALAIKDGRILEVGTSPEILALSGDATQVIDLAGKHILPGFIDGHCHPGFTADYLFTVHFSGTASMEDCVALIREYIESHPDEKVIRGLGWNNTAFPPEGPNKRVLDELSTEIPICLTSIDGHSLWVNSKVLELAGITKDTPDPATGIIARYADGEPTGMIVEEPGLTWVNSVLPAFSVAQYKEALKWFIEHKALPYGITGVFDAWIKKDSNVLKAYIELAEADELKVWVRSSFWAFCEQGAEQIEGFVSDRARIPEFETFKMEGFKIFLDGVIEGHTGVLLEPYDAAGSGKPEGYNAKPLWDQDRLNEVMAAAEKAGFRIHVHAIGDGAVRMTLDGLAYAKEQNHMEDTRHAIAHIQRIAPEDIPRFGELGVVASLNPAWMFKDNYYYTLQLPYLGKERAEEEYPAQSFLDVGAVITAGSDFYVTDPPNPLEGMQIGVTRTVPKTAGYDLSYGNVTDINDPKYYEPLWPEERVSLKNMLKAYTAGGAWANGLEHITGSLEVGKSADFVVIDEDIFAVDIETLRDIKVLNTVWRGEVVYTG